MEKKPLRVGAIVETTEGVIVVQDSKDKRRGFYLDKLNEKAIRNAQGKRRQAQAKRIDYARQLVYDGRFSLPGGKIEEKDYEQANATALIGIENPQTPEEIELFLQVVREAIAREIDEELGLGVDQDMIKYIMEIRGRTRDHIICLVPAQGIIKINRTELSGMNFLTDRPAIPLSEFFYQSHLRIVHDKYIRSEERQDYITRYLSKVNISEQVVMDAYAAQCIGYAYASLSSHQNSKPRIPPRKPESSPNFLIYDDKRNLYARPHEPVSFTTASSAKLVPPNLDRKKAQSARKKSDPAMMAVRASSDTGARSVEQYTRDMQNRSANIGNEDAEVDLAVPTSRRVKRTTAENLGEFFAQRAGRASKK